MRKALAVLFGALLMLSAFMSIYSTFMQPQPVAFSGADLFAPGSFSAPALQPLPAIEGDWIHSPDLSVLISLGNIYSGYGGNVRIEVKNNASRDIFLDRLAFEWTASGQRVEKDIRQYLNGNESYEIKAMTVPGPSTSGDKNYQLSISLLSYRNNGWYRIRIGGDDWVQFSEHTIEVIDPVDDNEYRLEHNFRTYYKRVNELVDLNSTAVASAAENATSSLGAGYNVGMVCAVFDYLDENCIYTEDPGGDKWYSPDQTLDSLTGDCEDYAMLISAMVDNLGGNSRVYLTKDHAFAAVYIGESQADLSRARDGIRAYYGTNLEIHTMSDDTGHWLIVDPLGSFYAGGFAVGQSPTELYNGTWNTTFEESDLLYAIDVTGNGLEVPMYMEPNFWMGMILVFGFFTIFSILTGGPKKTVPKTMCHICAQEVPAKELYLCPTCKTSYHSSCAHTQAYCMTCQQPILFPPPPNRP